MGLTPKHVYTRLTFSFFPYVRTVGKLSHIVLATSCISAVKRVLIIIIDVMLKAAKLRETTLTIPVFDFKNWETS
jgi:hypothetical protein